MTVPTIARRAASEPLKVNIGSGCRRLPGFLSVDNNPNAGQVDIVHELNVFPWPFADSSVSDVVMDHVLEHLDDTIGVIQELHRICTHNARVHICTPHFSCNWSHPGHRRAIGIGLFDHFDPQHDEHYGQCRFEVEQVHLHWMRPRYQRRRWRQMIVVPIDWMANLNPEVCQRFWCYWVGGFEEIEFHVRVVKSSADGEHEREG